jgi:hypothetical protein
VSRRTAVTTTQEELEAESLRVSEAETPRLHRKQMHSLMEGEESLAEVSAVLAINNKGSQTRVTEGIVLRFVQLFEPKCCFVTQVKPSPGAAPQTLKVAQSTDSLFQAYENLERTNDRLYQPNRNSTRNTANNNNSSNNNNSNNNTNNATGLILGRTSFRVSSNNNNAVLARNSVRGVPDVDLDVLSIWTRERHSLIAQLDRIEQLLNTTKVFDR